MVWVHSMTCFPLDLKYVSTLGAEAYGVNYPLQQEFGLEQRTGRDWQATDIEAAKAAGVDGFAVDIFTGDAGNYLAAADKVGGFAIAPCLDLSGVPEEKIEAVALEVIERNCKQMAEHPSAARVASASGPAFVFFTYGTGMMPPGSWRRVRDRLGQDGYKTYIVAAVEAGGDLGVMSTFPRETMASYLPIFEGGYSFGSTGPWWDRTAALLHEFRKGFGGGMMPGYYRLNGGYRDAAGTSLYRAEWHRHLDTNTDWACISTWNDLAENTGLMPLADWSLTRSELTRWFSARFRKEASPFPSPRLYVTTPKAVYRKRHYTVEGLALNPLRVPLRVSTQLVDRAGKPFGASVSAIVAPGGDGAATVNLGLNSFPPGRFLRARATLARNGRTLSSVLSAPILVMDQDEQPPLPTMYFSVPARYALPGRVRFSLQGRPSGDANAKACLSAPAGTHVRFAEVLQNTFLGKNFFDAPPFVAEVPRREGDGAIRGGTAWGFYFGRVTDDRLRVGYSDPVYVAPQGDVSVWESFSFDEGRGTTTRDASPWHKVPQLVGVEWISPGANGSGSALRLDGKNARISLSQYKTPLGPLSISMTVRPAKLGGFLYGDGGGLWAEIKLDGTVAFVVNTSDRGFVGAQGKTPLTPGQWTRLRFTNDGRASRIFVNDKLDAEVASGPLKDSGNPMIGGNPYGGGAFAGDVDDFELRALSLE